MSTNFHTLRELITEPREKMSASWHQSHFPPIWVLPKLHLASSTQHSALLKIRTTTTHTVDRCKIVCMCALEYKCTIRCFLFCLYPCYVLDLSLNWFVFLQFSLEPQFLGWVRTHTNSVLIRVGDDGLKGNYKLWGGQKDTVEHLAHPPACVFFCALLTLATWCPYSLGVPLIKTTGHWKDLKDSSSEREQWQKRSMNFLVPSRMTKGMLSA